MLASVAAAPACSCAWTSPAIASPVISGMSPLMISTGALGSITPAAAATASPVPRGCSWIATSTSSGRCSASRRFGLSTTTTRSAPAARAASSGQRIIGRPQIGCRTLGSAERIRVPSPAARMTTVGAGMGWHRSIAFAAPPFGGGVIGQHIRFWSWKPGFKSLPPSLRPTRTRTYVRATVHGSRRPRGDRRVDQLVARRCGDSGCARRAATTPLLKTLGGSVGISTEHFDPPFAQRGQLLQRDLTPLDGRPDRALVVQPRALKRRLFAEGLKPRRCELCGAGEVWRGRPHEPDPRPHQRRPRRQPAGEPADRLPELRGDPRHALRRATCRVRCPTCGDGVPAQRGGQRYCSLRCWHESAGVPRESTAQRKVPRPSYEQLCADLRELSWVAVGAKYGVSDNAVRKWMRRYEEERDVRRLSTAL